MKRGGPTSAPRETRCDVPSVEKLRELVELPLPLRLGSPTAKHRFLRDLYLDTPDNRLHQRGLTCRFRVLADDRRRLTVFLPAAGEGPDLAASRHEEDLDETDPLRALCGASGPARFLRGILEPELLQVSFAVHTERFIRASDRRLFRSQFQFVYDLVAVEKDGIVRSFQELRIRRLRGGLPRLAQISADLHEEHALRPLLVGRIEREWSIAAALGREGDRRSVGTGHAVALVALDRDTIACRSQDGTLQLPIADGSGEGACRHLLMECFGSRVGELHILGSVARDTAGKRLEVWLARNIRHGQSPAPGSGVMLWLSLEDLIARVGSGTVHDRETLAALLMATRSNLFSRGRDSTPRDAAPPLEPSEVGNGASDG